MKYYLKDILTRLQKQSATLDQSAFLVDKPWVVSNSEQGFEKLIFKRDGTLYLSSNGDVTEGKWEYLAEAQSLLIDYGDKKKLYRHQFLDEAVLALKIDGPDHGDDNYYLLANENKVPDYDAKKYLVNKLQKPEESQKRLNRNVTDSKKKNYTKHWSGLYLSPDGTQLVKFSGDRVVRKHKIFEYENGMRIWQYNIYPTVGDVVVDSKFKGGKYTLNAKDDNIYLLKVGNDGIIKSSYLKVWKVILISLLLILAFFFIITMFSI